MRLRFLPSFFLFSLPLLTMLLAGGCGEDSRPPSAISLDQIPAELGKAFASAKAEVKELSGQAATAVQGKDFSKAAMALQALTQRSDLSKLQSRTVAGASITVTAALREAEAKGDKQAAQALEIRRMTK